MVHLPAAKAKNIPFLYSNTGFSRVKNFFLNIFLKTHDSDKRLQNYGAINFVPLPFLNHPVMYVTVKIVTKSNI